MCMCMELGSFRRGLATTRSKLPSKIRFWNFPWNVFHHFGLTWGLCRVGTNPWVGFQMLPHLYKMFGTLIFSRWGGNRKSKAKLECEMFKLLDMLKIAGPFWRWPCLIMLPAKLLLLIDQMDKMHMHCRKYQFGDLTFWVKIMACKVWLKSIRFDI